MNLYTDLASIDIGSGSIKAAALSARASNGCAVRQLCEEPIPSGLVGGDCTNPFISDVWAFKNVLVKVLNQLKDCKNGLIIGLPDRWVKLSLNQMVLSKAELESPDFLAWRLSKTMPVTEDAQFNIDVQILNKVEGENNEPNTYRVLAAAVKTDMIKLLSRLTAELEIEVMAFDTSSLGVFNMFEALHPELVEGKILLHIHIGHLTTVVRAFDNGILIYERVIEVAGEEFTKIISELDNSSIQEADKTKQTEKFFSSSRADMAELIAKRGRIEAIFGNWLRELNVTFRFFQEKYGVLTAPKVILTGGGAMFSGVGAFVSEYLSTDCTVFNPFENLTFDNSIDKGLQKRAPIFACCLGLLAK